jgi:hypothetical protein
VTWRWLAAGVLLILPACLPRYAPVPRALPENDALGALPVRGPVVAPRPRLTRVQPEPSPEIRVSSSVDEFTGEASFLLEIGIANAGSQNGRPVRGTQFDQLRMVSRPGAHFAHVTIQVFSDRWQYLRCNSVHGLADDRRLEILRPDRSGRVLRRGVSETVDFGLGLEDLDAIASAELTRLRVCTTIYVLPSGSAAAVAEFVRRIRGGSANQPAEALPADQEIDMTE